MSIKLMGQVWECQFTKAEQSVMLAMTDHAKDDGTDCYPSIERVAWKTDYSTRQVQRVIKDLSGRGILILVRKGGRGRAAEYRIDLGKADPKPDFAPKKHDTMSSYTPKACPVRDDMVSPQTGSEKDDMVSPYQPKDDTMSSNTDPKRVTFDGVKGDISGLKDDIAMSPQSLTNKPSGGNGISSSEREVDFMPAIHPITALPFKPRPEGSRAITSPPPAPRPTDDPWAIAVAELSRTLAGGFVPMLQESRLELAGEIDGEDGKPARLYRLIVPAARAAQVPHFIRQAGTEIQKKLSNILSKRVYVEIVTYSTSVAEPEPAP